MSRSDEELLREALVHLRIAQKYGGADLDEQLVVDALCMRLSAGIEVLARLEDSRRVRLFGDDWALMWGMRNRIAHGYLLVSSSIVRQTIESDLPAMVETIERGVADLE